jgi:5-oxopent-3-ene-1,2,5-tricarboxylate decarboxylase/2-hydroxyhepta-2,4-diene-1,7-dioate isomerase
MARTLVRIADAPAPGWLAGDRTDPALTLRPAVDGTVYGVALNVRSTLEALGDAVNAPPYKAPPKAPVLYIKPPNTFRPHGGVVPVSGDVDALEVGATLAAVFGRTASRVNEAQALDYVLGYAVAIDVNIPHKSVFRPAIRQRCSDGFLPIGPGVVERTAVADPDNLTITVAVNGEEKQRWSTSELVRPLAKLIAEISDFMTFAEGDALLVGLPATNPLARVGDKVSASIDGVGRLDAVLAAETLVEWQA